MKKIVLIASLFSAVTFCQAEDVLQVVPFATTANVVADDYATFELIFNCESFQTNSMRFYVYLPEGMELTDDFDDSTGQYAFALDESRTTFVKMGKTQSTNHGVTYNKLGVADGYVKYAVVVASTGTTPLQGLTGKLADVYYKTSSTIADGVYPIYIRNVELNNSAEQEYLYPVNTSYVKIGNPSNASVVFEGKLPSFVNSALAKETAISALNLSAVTEVNGDFTYVDGRAVTAPAAELEVSAKYAKTVAEGKYASLTLPFDATFDDETAYKFTEVEGDYAKFDAVTSAQAGDVVLLTKSVNLTGSKLSTVAGATAAKAYYVSQDGSELRQGTNVNVPALRGVWEIEGAGSNLRIMLDGIATDIKMSDLVGEGAQAFDLQGRRTANAKNGVYVVNGKKQIVK